MGWKTSKAGSILKEFQTLLKINFFFLRSVFTICIGENTMHFEDIHAMFPR